MAYLLDNSLSFSHLLYNTQPGETIVCSGLAFFGIFLPRYLIWLLAMDRLALVVPTGYQRKGDLKQFCLPFYSP